MRRRGGLAVRVLVAACALALVATGAVGASGALQKPGRTVVRSGAIGPLTLNHGSIAFAVGRSARDCDHVELWNTDTKGIWRFGKAGPCTNLGSTGAGISAVGASGNRVLWVRYNGGNLRDWQLMTATTTLRTPRQLRFVEQDVDLPSPFTIGDSTADLGIPYAAGKEVVLLGTNGAAVFKHLDAQKVVAVAAGRGPAGAVVAALRQTGEVVLLRADGTIAWKAAWPAGAVKAIAIAPVGLVAQVGAAIEVRRPSGASTTRALPAGATMLDFAEGRVLYRLRQEIHALKLASVSDTLLLRGASGATLDTHGLAWSRGRSVSFACAGCVRYAG